MVHPSLPVHSTAELVAYAKANPGKINYGFVPGTIGHITTELFAKTAGFEITRVPYKGNGTALGDLIGGHISMMVLSIHADHRQRQGGHAAGAGRDHGERSKLLPDVPTDLANPGCQASRRRSATGLPRRPARRAPIIERLNKELRAAVSSDEMRERSGARGRRADCEHAGGIRRRDRRRGEKVGGRSSKAST